MTQRQTDAADDMTLPSITQTDMDATVIDEIDGAEEIRIKIEQTRTEMSSTIDAIQEKLNLEHMKEEVVSAAKEQAEHLKEQAVEAVREATIGKVEHAVQNVREATVGRAEQFMDEANVATKGVSGGVLDTIRANPLPAAIAGLSIGYLIMKGRNTPKNQTDNRAFQRRTASDDRYRTNQLRYTEDYPRSGYADRQTTYSVAQETGGFGSLVSKAGDVVSGVAGKAGDAAGSATGTAGDVIGTVAGKTGDVIGTVAGAAGGAVGTVAGTAGSAVGTVAQTIGDTAGNVGERIGAVREEIPYQTKMLSSRIQDMLEENPMAVGAVAVALGAAVGFLIPETQQEQRLLGDTRDKMVDTISDKAQTTVQNTVTKVQQVVQEVSHTAEKEAKRQGIVPTTPPTSDSQAATPVQ